MWNQFPHPYITLLHKYQNWVSEHSVASVTAFYVSLCNLVISVPDPYPKCQRILVQGHLVGNFILLQKVPTCRGHTPFLIIDREAGEIIRLVASVRLSVRLSVRPSVRQHSHG